MKLPRLKISAYLICEENKGMGVLRVSGSRWKVVRVDFWSDFCESRAVTKPSSDLG